MKSFKKLLEDIRVNPVEGQRAMIIKHIHGFTEKDVPQFGKPIASRQNLDLYQIHHGRPSHRGHGLFMDITNIDPDRINYDYEGGAFIVHDRDNNKFVGVMEYDSHEKIPNELHVKYLKSTVGPHRGIRNLIYDNATDRLGYTIVSDSVQTKSGQRGWQNDIRDGKNISVRYVRDHFNKDWDEIPANNVLPMHIWSSRGSTILHPNESIRPLSSRLYDERDVLLVRRPRQHYRI